jgi:hypothetical protein
VHLIRLIEAPLVLTVALLVVASALAQPPSPASPPPARPADVSSLEAIIAAVYDAISGPAGQAREWERFRSLFVPGARLIPSTPKKEGGAEAQVLTVEDYISRFGPRLEKDGFFEQEIARKVERFGNIAHVFSTYESRPFARGINSFQLLKDGGRWWVVTIYWESERADNPIPPEYLPRR